MKEVRERAVIPFTTNTKMPLFGNKKANKTEKLGDRYLAATFRERGLLGIVLADHERGAMVQNYQEHSPAAKVELPFGALIVGVNGEEVVGMPPEAVEVLIETGLRPITIVMELPEEQKYMALNARFGREGGLGIALHSELEPSMMQYTASMVQDMFKCRAHSQGVPVLSSRHRS